MKKVKLFYLIAVLALLSVSVVTFSGIVQAGTVPDGFMGVPWGANKAQVIKTMSEQGYQQLTCVQAGIDDLCFQGVFAEASCVLEFSFTGNSFYEGRARHCNRSESPDWPQLTFKNIVDMLSEKYGPPTKRGSEMEPGGYPRSSAVWHLVDNRSSDKYLIVVKCELRGFITGAQYVVDVFYGASSLEERLKKNAKNLY